MKRLFLVFAPLTLVGLLGLTDTACTKQEQTQIAAAITPGGACIANILAAIAGIEDPVAIAANCGETIVDVYQVVSELLANAPATLPAISDAGLAMDISNRARLVRIRDRAIALLTSDAGDQ